MYAQSLKAIALLTLLLAAKPSMSTSDIRGVNFDSNTSAIRFDARAILHEISEVMVRNPELQMRISGTSCASELNSEQLWFQRAVEVRTFLLQHGVAASQIIEIRKLPESYRPTTLDRGDPKTCSESSRLVEITSVPGDAL